MGSHDGGRGRNEREEGREPKERDETKERSHSRLEGAAGSCNERAVRFRKERGGRANA